ncbi:MAG TPA: hypothetical protein DDW92_00395 [Candidatus Veblenbacteria bacterium]|uniref:NADPH-dependent FMN reductase-like domain-containing protein n=1 Tax=Candidatus Veblenbacteria bacterium RIFOXYA2_FULL_43_9 TaxID=1802425 RepID=A0A1G2Q1C7_9BACT|nr:MAG: hypothetical protein A2226_03110 [Candidatus Veblenbacteria bacterium RIFOXYA2_FULL_43_9]HBH16715.1 hypothetical protein [Candidatus Veblenbacteria bacterium]
MNKFFSNSPKVKILGLSGSPRGAESSSEKMLNTCLTWAEKHGAETKMIRLKDKNILPCEGCYSKTQDGAGCVFPCIHDGKDDTMEVMNAIIEANGLVISTPAYWGSASSLVQTVIEKMITVENNQPYKLLGKTAVLIVSQDSDGAAMVCGQLSWALNHMGIYVLPWGMIYKPSILNNPLAKFGMRLLRYGKLDWIDRTVERAGRNIALVSQRLKGFDFEDKHIPEHKN